MSEDLAIWVPIIGVAQMVPGIVPSAQQKASLELSGGNVSYYTLSVSAVDILSTSVGLQLAFARLTVFQPRKQKSVMKLSTKDGLVQVVFSIEVHRRFVQQDFSAASTLVCNTETAAVKHKGRTPVVCNNALYNAKQQTE